MTGAPDPVPDALGRVAAALRADHDHARALLEAFQDALLVISRDREILEVSDSLCALFGLRRDQLVGVRPPYPYWAPERVAESQSLLEAGLARERSEDVITFRHADGHDVHVILTRAALHDDAGAIVGHVVVMKDMTARVEAERAAARRAAELEALSSTVPIASWLHALDGSVVLSNGRWEELTGQPTPETEALGWTRIVHPDDLQGIVADWERITTGGADEVRHTIRITHQRTGEERVLAEHARLVVDDRGEGIAIAGASWDVTDEARAAAELRRHAAEMDALTRTLPAALWRLAPDGRMTYVTDQWATIVGQEPGAALGWGWLDAIHPDDRSAMVGAYRRALGCGDEWRHEYRLLMPDGDVRWVFDAGLPVRDEHGEVTHYVGTTLDVTARRRADDRVVERASQQAAVAELGRRALGRDSSLEELLHEAAAVLRAVLRVPYASVMELHAEVDGLESVASQGVPLDATGRIVPRGRSLASFALDRDAPVASSDPAADGWLASAGVFADLGIASGVAAPIRLRDEPFGAIAAYALEGRVFSADDVNFVVSVAHIVGSAIQRGRDEERIWRQAHHDVVTRLPNRALLLDRVRNALERAQRTQATVAVLFLDLDRFKNVNDSLGHHVGDELLRAVAERLLAAVRPGDTVARIGGDEFVILCDEIAGDEAAHAVATRVVETLRQPFALDGDEVYATVSVGYALAAAGDAGADDLLRDADAAMYRAKESGRNRAEAFDEETRVRALARLRTETALRRALEPDANELVAWFQPIVALRDGRLEGFEALVRWQHPDGGVRSPAEFVPIAEETGLVGALGSRVLEQAVAALAAWNACAPDDRPLHVNVNLAAQQVIDPSLVATVAALLERWSIQPAQLILELTETGLLRDAAAASRTIHELAEIGVRVYLDDFGVGFSSIAHLDFEIAGLKIDREVVARAFAPDGDLTTVDGIVRLAAAKRIPHVVVEGIEELAMVGPLRALGCELGQGYGFARPLPPEAALALVAERAAYPVDAERPAS